MKPALLFRIAAVLFLFFAAGHTFGFLSFKPDSPEGLAVMKAMDNVHFEAQGKIFSYGGWYRGFGLTATVSMIFEAFLAWHLGTMARRGSRDVVILGWAFFAWQIPSLVLCFIYFGVAPMVLSLAVALLIAVSTWLAGRAAQPERSLHA
jgi:hypothetical protein